MLTDTTYLFPQTVISNGQFTGNPWNNPQNLLAMDGSYATTPPTSTLGSDVVVGNFLFNIPQNSVIAGIEISFRGFRGGASSPATAIEVYAYDNTNGNNFFYLQTPIFNSFTTVPVTYYFGSPSYLFNTTWTADQINNLKLRLQANGDISLDGVQVRVTYQTPATGTTPNQDVCASIFQAQPFRLIQPVGANALETSWLVDRFETSDGVPITNADIGPEGIPITTDQGTQNEENQYVTLITPTVGNQRILTVTRGWSMRDPNVQGAPLRPHGAGAEIIIGNSIQFYDIFLRKCHIGSLVSAPILGYDEGVLITSYIRSLNWVGTGVTATGSVNPTGGKDITITIPGVGTTPPVVVTSGAGNTGGVQVNTVTDANVTCTGVDRLLVVSISLQSTQTLTGVTYNGVAMTFRDAQNQGAVRVEVWTLTAPALGTHSLVINASGLTYLAWEWACFNHSDQVTPFTIGTNNSGNTGTSTGGTTTVTDNAIVIHALATKLVGVSYTPGGGETIVASTITGAVQGALQTQPVGTPAAVTSDIFLSVATDWANVIASINGVAPTIPISQVPIQFQDEGANLGTPGTVNTVDFVGAGVTATRVGNIVTVTIPTGSSGEVVQKTFTQAAHGFTDSQVLRSNGVDGEYTLAQADTGANADVVGIITSVPTVNTFVLTTEGYAIIPTLPGGAVAGDNLYLDPAIAGALTLIDPAIANVPGTVSQPLARVIDAATGLCYIHNWRGQEQQSTPIGAGSYTVNADETVSTWLTSQIPCPLKDTGLSSDPGYWITSGAADITVAGADYFKMSAVTPTAYTSFYTFAGTFADTKDLRTKFMFVINAALDATRMYAFGLGADGTDFWDRTDIQESARFVVDNATLYAVVGDGVGVTEVSLGAITVNTSYLAEIIWNNGTSFEFYLNGALVATITTDMPSSGNMNLVTAGNASAGSAQFTVVAPTVSREI